jgi:bifunctional non-homologous end joining protein LigD
MLARSGPLPTRGSWAFELKWDGFRALVSTLDGLRARSRRGWDMTPSVGELAALPPGLVLDGELVALRRGRPHFPLVCRRLLQRDASVPLTYVVFDVLALDGEPTTGLPYAGRRALLEALELGRGPWFLTPTFDDGEALFEAVCEHALEGVVAKPLASYPASAAGRR